MFRLDGRRALVTGGTSGIGEAVARTLLGAGARVVIAARDPARGQAVRDALAALGEVHFLPADVGSEPSVEALVAGTVDRLGGLDVLVNNAGAIDRTPLHALDLARWEGVLRTNLTGCYLVSRHALPHLRARGGAVVNVASYLAFRAGSGLTVAYNAAKAGIVALTRTMAVAYGPEGVRVNAVCPAFVPTALNRDLWARYTAEDWEHLTQAYPLRRVGTPEDVAHAVLFLASDEAGWITGVALMVDGGLTAR